MVLVWAENARRGQKKGGGHVIPPFFFFFFLRVYSEVKCRVRSKKKKEFIVLYVGCASDEMRAETEIHHREIS